MGRLGRLGVVLVVMLALMGGSTGLGGAQRAATPAAGDGRRAVDPQLDDPVSVVDARGNAFVEVTVTDVIRPWEEFGEFEEPERGSEYVAFVIEFANVSDDPVTVDPFRFTLQDTQGFVYGTAFAQGEEKAKRPPLTAAAEVDGGDRREFLVVFTIFEDQEMAHLFWQPDSDRLVTLVQLEGQ